MSENAKVWIFALFYFGLSGSMAIWPKWFYEHSKMRGELSSNGPLLTRIVAICLMILPIAGWVLVKAIE